LNYESLANKKNVTRIHEYDFDPFIYKLLINFNQPLDDSLNNVKVFCKETENGIRLQYHHDEEEMKAAASNNEWGLISVRNFLMESTQKKKNQFRNWETCLNIYDVWKKNPDKKAQEIADLVECPYAELDQSNRIHFVTKNNNEAIRLIASAENGNFPF
jgi:hypothetical protein